MRARCAFGSGAGMSGLAAEIGRELRSGVAAAWEAPVTLRGRGVFVSLLGLVTVVALASYHAADPSWNAASGHGPENLLGGFGANISDVLMQSLGVGAWVAALLVIASGLRRAGDAEPHESRLSLRVRALVGVISVLALSGVLAAPATPAAWPLARGLGGFWGDAVLNLLESGVGAIGLPHATIISAVILALIAVPAL